MRKTQATLKLLVSRMNPLKCRCSSGSSSAASEHVLPIINLHPEGKLEQSLDTNKSVFKEQLSLADAAASGKNNSTRGKLSSRKTPNKKKSLSVLLYLSGISVLLYFIVTKQNKKKKKKRQKEKTNSFRLHSIYAKTTHELYDTANKRCQIKVAKRSAIHTCRLCVCVCVGERAEELA